MMTHFKSHYLERRSGQSKERYTILNNGCSFSIGKKIKNTFSYCEFLPGKVYNIGKSGSGLESTRIQQFFNKKRKAKTQYDPRLESYYNDTHLTHFIYQIPDPSRQPIDLNEYSYEFMNCNDSSIWRCLSIDPKEREQPGCRDNYKNIFNNIQKYYNKSLGIIQQNINIIRDKFPNIKIIFLRYSHTRTPLIYEFNRLFYKDTITEYCNKHNITYIFEKTFNTNWFSKNTLTASDGARKGDKMHPNKTGAKLIANKIKEYL